MAQLLGAREVPASRGEVADYLQQIRPQLVCSPTTRNGARLLLAPPMPWRVRLLTPARPAWAALGALSFCLMPRWARRWRCGRCAQQRCGCPSVTGSGR